VIWHVCVFDRDAVQARGDRGRRHRHVRDPGHVSGGVRGTGSVQRRGGQLGGRLRAGFRHHGPQVVPGAAAGAPPNQGRQGRQLAAALRPRRQQSGHAPPQTGRNLRGSVYSIFPETAHIRENMNLTF